VEPSLERAGGADSSLRLTRSDGIAVLEMAHGRANAFDLAFLRALRAGVRDAAGSARAIVLTASGSIFGAGVDLRRIQELDRAGMSEFLRELSDMFAELFAAPLPVVAAVNGHAIAGGAILAFACDHRILARDAGSIGVPELRVGVPFPIVPLEIVRYALGHDRAQRAVLGGLMVGAEDAVAAGMADEVVDRDRLRDRGLEVAAAMSSGPAASYARAKADLRRPVIERWTRERPAHDAQTLDGWDAPESRAAIRDYVARTLRRQ
jgi:enoyl-CoA hydratase/carnithine racemase